MSEVGTVTGESVESIKKDVELLCTEAAEVSDYENKTKLELRFNEAFNRIDEAKKEKSTSNANKRKLTKLSGTLYDAYEEMEHRILWKTVRDLDEVKRSLKKEQGVQLSVFSLVLTILAFVLTNAKILGDMDVTVAGILVVNISYLVCVGFLFGLIYVFLTGVVSEGAKRWAVGFVVLLFILLAVGLVLLLLNPELLRLPVVERITDGASPTAMPALSPNPTVFPATTILPTTGGG